VASGYEQVVLMDELETEFQPGDRVMRNSIAYLKIFRNHVRYFIRNL
jgi:hypothetical protein